MPPKFITSLGAQRTERGGWGQGGGQSTHYGEFPKWGLRQKCFSLKFCFVRHLKCIWRPWHSTCSRSVTKEKGQNMKSDNPEPWLYPPWAVSHISAPRWQIFLWFWHSWNKDRSTTPRQLSWRENQKVGIKWHLTRRSSQLGEEACKNQATKPHFYLYSFKRLSAILWRSQMGAPTVLSQS